MYSIPDELIISSGAAIFLQYFNTTNISDSITFEFTGTGGLTFADDSGFIDTYIGGRNQMPFGSRNFTLNMGANDVTGPGSIINGIFVLDGLTGDTMNLDVNTEGDFSIGTIDLRKNDSFGGFINIEAGGDVSLDKTFVGDVSLGGSSANNIDITASSITLNEIDTRALRGDGAATNGTINLTALAAPDFSPNNIAGNTAAANTVTLTGPVITNGPGVQGGNLNVTAVKVVLENTFSTDLAGNGDFNIEAGFVGGGFTEGDLLMNNSGVTPDAVTFGVFHDGVGPPLIEWADNVSGNWLANGNWDLNAAPTVNSQTALFGGNITSPQTVFFNGSVTVKGVQFDTGSTVALAGTGTLNLEANSGSASVEALQGSHQVQVAVNLITSTTFNAAAGAVVDFNNAIDTGGNALTISGAGQVNLNNLVTGSGSVSSSAILGGAGPNAIAGDLSSTGTLDIDIAGLAVAEFDSFDVSGTATLSGSLNVDLASGFTPVDGDAFDVLTASSIVDNGLTLTGDSAGFSLSIVSSGVNGDDFLNIQRNDPSQIPAWESQYGLGGGGSSVLRLTYAAAAVAAVPEPGPGFLVATVLMTLGISRQRNKG